MAGKNAHKIRIRSRRGDDPKALLNVIQLMIEGKPDRPLDIDIDTTEIGEPLLASPGLVEVPDEPRETEVCKRLNEHLEQKSERIRESGGDPDGRSIIPAGERIRARDRVKNFGSWFAQQCFGSAIGVSIRVLWESLKPGA